MRPDFLLLALGICCLAPGLSAAGDTQQSVLTQAISVQQRLQSEAKSSQQRIDKLDDQSQALLQRYLAASAELDDLRVYNAQTARLLAEQSVDIAELRDQLEQIEVTRRRIVPLLLAMLDGLEQFVAADVPFLIDERGQRLARLRELLDDPSIAVGEKYRRLLEAYRIEVGYGYDLEVYQGELTATSESDRPRTVDFLRLGRVALFYVSLDGQQAGRWDAGTGAWRPVAEPRLADLKQGLRVARGRAAPELLVLPIPAPEPRP